MKVYFQWIRVRCVTSAAPVELIGFTFTLKAYVLPSSHSTVLCICPVPALGVWSPLEHTWWMPGRDAAIQLNFAPNRQEVKQRNNNKTSGYFSNKTFRLDTSRQIS